MCLLWLFLYVFVMFVMFVMFVHCQRGFSAAGFLLISFALQSLQASWKVLHGLDQHPPFPRGLARFGSIRLALSGPKIQKIIQVHENIQGMSEYPSWSKIPRDSKRFQDHLLGLTGYGSAKSNEITLCDSEISQIFTVAFQAHQFWLQSWYRRLHPVASGCIRLHWVWKVQPKPWAQKVWRTALLCLAFWYFLMPGSGSKIIQVDPFDP